MKVIKFTINEKYYNELKEICLQEELTIKRKINILLSQDTQCINIRDYFPEDYNQDIKKVTLKINEELYKGIMKKCGKLDLKTREYVPYLIYRYLGSLKN